MQFVTVVLPLVVLSNTFASSTAFVPNPTILSRTTKATTSSIFPNRISQFNVQTQTKQSKRNSSRNSQDGNSNLDINGSATANDSINANGSGGYVKSNLSLEELRYIAESKGYDTIGIDRKGLEMIASDWTARTSSDTELESGSSIMVPYSYNRYETRDNTIPNPNLSSSTPSQLTTAYSKADSFKASIVGFFTGAIAVSPVTYLHTYTFPSEIIENQLSQFMFDTFTGGISAGAFATIYRYFIAPPSPSGGKDESVSNAIVGAFILAKSFSRIRVSYYCDGLYCGEPLGFMDWTMVQQFSLSCFENLALFGAVAITLEYACFKGWVSYPKQQQK